MQKFVYPRDYLDQRGNIKHCWEVHVKKMKECWLPYVDYNAFYYRLKRWHWDLYRCIHTPLDYRRLERHEKASVWLRTQRFRFIYLFKKDEWRVKRGKGHGYAC